MDPIQPIEPRHPWIEPLSREQPERGARERREQAARERQEREARHAARKSKDEPEDDGREGRHIDVRA